MVRTVDGIWNLSWCGVYSTIYKALYIRGAGFLQQEAAFLLHLKSFINSGVLPNTGKPVDNEVQKRVPFTKIKRLT